MNRTYMWFALLIALILISSNTLINNSFSASNPLFEFTGENKIEKRTKNIYVADFGNNRIQVFDSSGKFLFKFGSSEIDAVKFRPSSIVFDNYSNLYVTEFDNDRLSVFDLSGNLLIKFENYCVINSVPECLSSLELNKLDLSEELNPSIATAVDFNGKTYYAELKEHAIVIYDWDGNVLTSFENIHWPRDVVIDRSGKFYIVAKIGSTIQVYVDPQFLLFEFEKNDPNQFGMISGIALDEIGNIYAGDFLYDTVSVFNPTGKFLFEFGTTGHKDGQLLGPLGIVVDVNQADSQNGNLITYSFEPRIFSETVTARALGMVTVLHICETNTPLQSVYLLHALLPSLSFFIDILFLQGLTDSIDLIYGC